MTRDELLALLNERDINCEKNCQSAYGALRAVVELHGPSPDGKHCYGCFELSDGALYPTYPCLHIQAIERELR